MAGPGFAASQYDLKYLSQFWILLHDPGQGLRFLPDSCFCFPLDHDLQRVWRLSADKALHIWNVHLAPVRCRFGQGIQDASGLSLQPRQ